MVNQRYEPLLLALLTIGTSFNVVSSSDAENLLAFKATLSDPTGSLRSWEANSNPCNNGSSWDGVLCHEGAVVGLRLEDTNLNGTLDLDALKSSRRIRSLSFMGNRFHGPMPSLANFPKLRAIYLSENQFSGTISADAFSNLLFLKKLHMWCNQFSGPIPTSIANLQNLNELRLDGNKFDGQIPNFQQKELKMVNLSSNNLEGPIPASLSKFGQSLFANNKGLCGEPLGIACKSTPLTPQQPTTHRTTVAIEVLSCTMFSVIIVLYARPKQKDMDKPEGASSELSSPTSSRVIKLEEGSMSSTAFGGVALRKAAEQPRLTFLRNDRGRFELQDLLESSAEVIGTSELGSSYNAMLVDGSSIVVKRYKDLNKAGKEDFDEHMRRLGRLSHPNLLPLVAYYNKREEKMMVHEYAPNRSLAKALHAKPGTKTIELDWPARLKIVKGVAIAMNYLYEEFQMLMVPHGHLKSSNVLLSDSLEPLLNDYALLPVMNPSSATKVMAAYKAPEYKQSGQTSKKCDLWCFGIIVLEILTGKIPKTDPKDVNVDIEHWVKYLIAEERTDEIFDKNMKATIESKDDMIKLLHIGLACCEESVDKRYDIGTLLDKLDELKDDGRGKDDYDLSLVTL